MKAIVVYESLTGNTRDAGRMIAAELEAHGIPCSASPVDQVNMQALSEADLVVVGTWTDGLFLFGQKPGRPWRLAKLPVIDGKTTAIYCTYAINPGKTLEHFQGIIERRGGDVVGGYAIKRDDLAGGAAEFVARLIGAGVARTGATV